MTADVSIELMEAVLRPLTEEERRAAVVTVSTSAAKQSRAGEEKRPSERMRSATVPAPAAWPRLSESLTGPKHPDKCQKCGRSREALAEAGLYLNAWQECAEDGRDTPEDVYLMLCSGCNLEGETPSGRPQQGIVMRHPRFYRKLATFAPVPGIMAPLCVDCRFRDGTHCTHPDRKANGGDGTLQVIGPKGNRAHYNLGRRAASGFYTTYSGPATSCSGREAIPEAERLPTDLFEAASEMGEMT